jgi:hypothetical protein
MFIDTPACDVRIVMITSGSGASTGFAIGEEVVADLFGGAQADGDTRSLRSGHL